MLPFPEAQDRQGELLGHKCAVLRLEEVREPQAATQQDGLLPGVHEWTQGTMGGGNLPRKEEDRLIDTVSSTGDVAHHACLRSHELPYSS